MVKVNELKAELRRSGLTQEQLARKLGIDPSTLNKKLNNTDGSILSVKIANAIAKELNLSTNELVNIFFAPELAETQDYITKNELTTV